MEVFSKLYKLGCQSWLTGVECLDPKIAFDFYEALKSKDFKFCNFIINKIERPFFKMISKYGWHIAVKSCLSEMNLMHRFERSPLRQLNKNQHKNIVKFMEYLRNVSKAAGKDYFKKVS